MPDIVFDRDGRFFRYGGFSAIRYGHGSGGSELPVVAGQPKAIVRLDGACGRVGAEGRPGQQNGGEQGNSGSRGR